MTQGISSVVKGDKSDESDEGVEWVEEDFRRLCMWLVCEQADSAGWSIKIHEYDSTDDVVFVSLSKNLWTLQFTLTRDYVPYTLDQLELIEDLIERDKHDGEVRNS